MNSTPEAAETSEPASKPKKQISAQRRIISWVFIAILLGVVVLEWKAKSSQASTVKGLEAALETAGDVGEIPLQQFQSIKVGKNSEELDESGVILKIIHYRWKGIFKTYNLRLLVDEGDMVIAFDEQSEGKSVGGISPISKKNIQALVGQHKKGGSKEPVEEKQAEAKGEASGEPSEK
ncbi:hypothetical protein [uncultured Gimesia sp.]|uniref:hypothetical protein n=1 Tax=uncultured Gimesia sp. TaxID=1678688 RepID=UPI0026154E80|nr:hypothetical protein [uncultured Gimesia sp.]